MARALALAVDDPGPKLAAGDLVKDGSGEGRWFDCFVAQANEGLLGYALACRIYEAHAGGRRLWLGDLYVRPEARRLGIGRALLAAVARRASELGCRAVIWEVWKLNESGRAFYRTLGPGEDADLAVMRLGVAEAARV